MSSRQDSFIDVWVNQPVVNGTTIASPVMLLNACSSFSVHAVTQNSAAGTVSMCVTNMPSQIATFGGGLPAVAAASNGTVGANSLVQLNFSTSSPFVTFAAMYITFAPTASGNLFLSVAIKRYPG